MTEVTTQDSLSRKEREKLARQQDILRAARELFATKGFRDTTLDEIAHHAEFGKGTLYNYFANKEEIFHAIIDQSIEDSLSIARQSVEAEGGLREKLSLLARKTIRYIWENGELLHAIYHELHRAGRAEATRFRDIIKRASGMWGSLAELLQKEMDEGRIRACDPAQYVILFDGMVRGYCFKKFALEESGSDEEFAQAAELIVSVFLDGITERTSKG
jgi:TetR/AcrR family transcriptional regulator, repressor of fatR-cypB operon